MSTFQIAMNEAWNDVTGEVMCGSNHWWATNLYFIVLHLVSSVVSNEHVHTTLSQGCDKLLIRFY